MTLTALLHITQCPTAKVRQTKRNKVTMGMQKIIRMSCSCHGVAFNVSALFGTLENHYKILCKLANILHITILSPRE